MPVSYIYIYKIIPSGDSRSSSDILACAASIINGEHVYFIRSGFSAKAVFIIIEAEKAWWTPKLNYIANQVVFISLKSAIYFDRRSQSVMSGEVTIYLQLLQIY